MHAKGKPVHASAPPNARIRQNTMNEARAIGTPRECRGYVSRITSQRALENLQRLQVAMLAAQDSVRAAKDGKTEAEVRALRKTDAFMALAKRSRATKAAYDRATGNVGEGKAIEVSQGAASWGEVK